MKKLSSLETLERREAVDFANASVRLEGLEPSPEALERGEQFVRGEIEAKDLVPKKPDPMSVMMDYFQSPKFREDFQKTIANDRLKEQTFRQKIVDQVNASNALEGYTPDEHLAELQRRFIALEIGTAEILESAREFAVKMQKLYPAPPPSLTEDNV